MLRKPSGGLWPPSGYNHPGSKGRAMSDIRKHFSNDLFSKIPVPIDDEAPGWLYLTVTRRLTR